MRNRQHGAFVLWTSLILSLIAIDSPLFVGASRDESASDEASTSSLKEGRRTRANEVFSIGNNHYQKKEFNDAIQQYKIAINLNPDVISYYSNLGNCLREVSEYEESIRILQKAVFLNEEHSKSWYNLGVTYQTMGLYIDAISSYNNATMLTPDYLNAHYNKGLSYQESGDLENAQKSYVRVLELNTQHSPSKLNFCNILFAISKSDKFDDVLKCYEGVLTMDPTYVRGIVNLAGFYQSTSDDALAVEYYQKALLIDPSNVMAKHGITSLKFTEIKSGGTKDISNENRDENTTNGNEELDGQYVSELFDSYSFHFESSLKNLNYQSHILIAAGLGKYLLGSTLSKLSNNDDNNSNNNGIKGNYDDRDNENNENNSRNSNNNDNSSNNNNNDNNNNNNNDDHNDNKTNDDDNNNNYYDNVLSSNDQIDNNRNINVNNNNVLDSESESELESESKSELESESESELELEVDILGLDLGAGTGLACTPIRSEILKLIDTHNNIIKNKRNNNNEKINTSIPRKIMKNINIEITTIGDMKQIEDCEDDGESKSQVQNQFQPQNKIKSCQNNKDENGKNSNSIEGQKNENSYENDSNDNKNEFKNDNKNSDNNTVGNTNNILISPHVAIIGIDLSPKMLFQAKLKNCYADTVVSDVTVFVQEYAKNVRSAEKIKMKTENKNENIKISENSNYGESREFYPFLDFIAAADVFMYLGDLKLVMESSFKILKNNGILIFTVEALIDEKIEKNISWLENEVLRNENYINHDNHAEVRTIDGENDNRKMNKNDGISIHDSDVSHALHRRTGSDGNNANGNTNRNRNNDENKNNRKKEKEKEKDFYLQSSGRIAHTHTYIQKMAFLTNFTILEISKQIPRIDRGKKVKGYLVILKKVVT